MTTPPERDPRPPSTARGGNGRFVLLVVVAVIILAGLWWLTQGGAPGGAANADGTAGTTPGIFSAAATPPQASPPKTLPPTEISHAADALNAPTGNIRADLRLVSELIETFRSNFSREGNPVGDNAEITAVLAGRNSLRFAFIDPRHTAINARGELCDRWGTPFFFHAESGTLMKIRSAGPDKKMWTADDVEAGP